MGECRALALKLKSGTAKSPCRGFATRILIRDRQMSVPVLFCAMSAPAERPEAWACWPTELAAMRAEHAWTPYFSSSSGRGALERDQGRRERAACGLRQP